MPLQLRPPQMMQGQPGSQAPLTVQQQQQQRNNAQVAQLQSILQSNQMPDGRPLTDEIRNSIIARLTHAQRAPMPGQRGDRMCLLSSLSLCTAATHMPVH